VGKNRQDSTIQEALIQKVLELTLQVPHKTQLQIAKELKMSRQRISQIQQSEEFKKRLEEHNKSWLDIILEARPKAAKVLIDLLSSEHPNIAIRAAENILQLDKIDTTAHDGEELPPY